jgi:hypothetical protein
MKTCGGVENSFTILTSALNRYKWIALPHGRFTPGEKATGIHWQGEWVAPDRVSTLWSRGKILALAGN